MSRSSLQALGVIAIVAVMSLTGLPSASARAVHVDPDGAAPLVVHARSTTHDHFTSSAAIALAGGGTGTVVSPTLPKGMTKATVTVSTDVSDQPGFKEVTFALLRQPTPGKKLVACITMARLSLGGTMWSAAMQDDLATFEAVADQLFLARLDYCMQVARLIASVQAEAGVRVAASSSCAQVPLGFNEQVTRSGGGYAVSASGPVTVKKKNAGGVRITCTLAGPGKTVMKVRARKKGQSLQRALGSSNLALALGSAATATSGATVTVGFKP